MLSVVLEQDIKADIPYLDNGLSDQNFIKLWHIIRLIHSLAHFKKFMIFYVQ